MRPELLDLNEVVAHLIKMLGRLIGENIDLRFVPSRHPGIVRADRGMIEQILINLCVNARDAIGVTGTLTIETGEAAFDDEFCRLNPWASPGQFVLLAVADTGAGMSAETLARIFEPFFTTKPVGEGTGLGLATVYGIVQQHGGLVRACSEVSKGSVFKVYLPAAGGAPEPETAIEDSSPAGGSETILFAEDDAVIRKLVTLTLRSAGYTVLVAEDGVEAVQLFTDHAGDIDLLLLDVVMPGIGGREALDQIQQLAPEVPALFSSGYSEHDIHTNFVLTEGTRLIQKPYAPTNLLRQIREILDNLRVKR